MRPRAEPDPGQESVWDYPRPPRLEPFSGQVEVFFSERRVASSTRAIRCLETSHPPVYYLPASDVWLEGLRRTSRSSYCEFKGLAVYYDLWVEGHRSRRAAWSYPDPLAPYQDLTGYLSFYASRVDECRVDGEMVMAQEGDFYGGWITGNVVGPFKGGQGTLGW